MGAKTDFTAMSDDDLCRWIAQRRGWTDVHQAQDGMWWGLPPGGRSTYLPDWTGDLNAAWEDLLSELPEKYIPHPMPGSAAPAARAIAEAWAWWEERGNDD